jgi:riboflavin synthase
MFSGIIEELGKVKSIRARGPILRIQIEASKVAEDLKVGDSLAVNGACLTLVAKTSTALDFELMRETVQKTNIGKLKVGELVNLERALKVGDRVSGHFVNGHVDCTGVIIQKIHKNNNLGFVIRFPGQYLKFIVEKGSIAVDGISLTVGEVRANTFTVYLIPHTLGNTTFRFKGPSALVNLEFDTLLKLRR